MQETYQKTLSVLAKSSNRAAVRVLEAAMHSSDNRIRHGAISAALKNWSTRKLVELIRDFEKMDEESVAVLQEEPSKLAAAIRISMLSSDSHLQRNAIRAALQLHVYELIPMLLITLLESSDKIKSDLPFSEVIQKLTQDFSKEINNNTLKKGRQELLLRDIGEMITRTVDLAQRKDITNILKTLLFLHVHLVRLSPGLSDIFNNPSRPAYRILAKMLHEDSAPSIIQFVVDSLSVENAPIMAITAISRRTDFHFIQSLLRKITAAPSVTVKGNLSKITRLEWLSSGRALIVQLNDEEQASLVQLVRSTSIPAQESYGIFSAILLYGLPAGRQSAVTALATHPGADVDEIILKASTDASPEVQAAAVRQLRGRQTPTAMKRLLELAGNPHPVVQEAVREMLPEFRISRFLATFENMSLEQQKQSFKMVRLLDPKANEYLKRELLYASSQNKAKAIRCVEIADAVPFFEDALCVMLTEAEETTLRAKAAQLLAHGQREVSRNALLQSIHRDTSLEVKVTAKSSLALRIQRAQANG